MGLGKTVQVIALICHLIEMRISGPYLIVAPLSTIPNWVSEFKRFAPDIPVVLFHGYGQEREALYPKIKKKYSVEDFKTLPVVITTYQVPIIEEGILRRLNWQYIIVDEGQRLKNPHCQLMKYV